MMLHILSSGIFQVILKKKILLKLIPNCVSLSTCVYIPVGCSVYVYYMYMVGGGDCSKCAFCFFS